MTNPLTSRSRELVADRAELPADPLQARVANWQPPEPRYPHRVFARYAVLVTSASEGAMLWMP